VIINKTSIFIIFNLSEAIIEGVYLFIFIGCNFFSIFINKSVIITAFNGCEAIFKRFYFAEFTTNYFFSICINKTSFFWRCGAADCCESIAEVESTIIIERTNFFSGFIDISVTMFFFFYKGETFAEVVGIGIDELDDFSASSIDEAEFSCFFYFG